MDTHRWGELRRLFDAAVELSPQVWDGYLRDASDDIGLRREVAELLRIDMRLRAGERPPDRGSGSAAAMAARLAEMPVDPRIGSSIGAWRPLWVLGQGSGGVVYLAESLRDPGSGHVALKLPLADADALVRERFRAECEALQRLPHPGVVRLIEARLDTESEPCLVFEHVDGRDLRRHCILKQLGPAARVALFVAICDIVAQIHASGVAHGDLRPENIRVTREGRPVLLDFGRATCWACDAGPDDETREAAIARDLQALALLLRALWHWPAGRAVAHGEARLDAELAVIAARVQPADRRTLSDLIDALRAALRDVEPAEAERADREQASPFTHEADAIDTTLLHCALAKSTRQSRRLAGDVEESPGSAGQSAR